MYDIDPRLEWLPAMRQQPWQLWDLTPPQLEALVAYHTASPEAPGG
jgi:hypothetical protein